MYSSMSVPGIGSYGHNARSIVVAVLLRSYRTMLTHYLLVVFAGVLRNFLVVIRCISHPRGTSCPHFNNRACKAPHKTDVALTVFRSLKTSRLTFLRMRNKCKIIYVQPNNKAFLV